MTYAIAFAAVVWSACFFAALWGLLSGPKHPPPNRLVGRLWAARSITRARK